MNKQDYDKYYQQGGSYVIPVEIFNELFEDYECFKNDCKKYKEVIDKIKNICDKVPYTWSICGINVVHKIESIIEEVKE